MINNKEDWYRLYNSNKNNLLYIVNTYNPKEVEKIKSLSSSIDGLSIVSILNTAFHNAPDSPSIHYTPGWSALCDLCSESWVFEDEYTDGH